MPTQENTVVFLPGGIMPAALQYEPLLAVLKDEVHPIFQDLAVYNDDAPPPDYSLEKEIESIADNPSILSQTSFHLVGYSGGGAVALAFVAKYPERVASLALTEPAVIPSREWFRREAAVMAEFAHVMSLPPAEQMREFVRVHLRPGVQPPPPPQGAPPPYMAKRPAGLKAMDRAFESYDLDLNRLRQFRKLVYLAIGSLSNSVEERKAKFLADHFPYMRLEIYEGRHHFDPPQRAEPVRYASALRELWAKADLDITQK